MTNIRNQNLPNDHRLALLRQLQSATGEELDALLPSAEGATIGSGV